MSIREIYDTILRQHQRGSAIDSGTWITLAEALETVASRSAVHSSFWDLNSMALACRERAQKGSACEDHD